MRKNDVCLTKNFPQICDWNISKKLKKIKFYLKIWEKYILPDDNDNAYFSAYSFSSLRFGTNDQYWNTLFWFCEVIFLFLFHCYNRKR